MSWRTLNRMGLVIALGLVLAPAGALGQEEKTDFEGWDSEGKQETPPEKKDAEVEATTQATAPVTTAESATPAPLLPPVTVRYGSVSLMGVFQTLMNTNIILDDNTDSETWGFEFQRARIQLAGHLITEKLEYFFQGDARNMASFALDMGLKYTFGSSGLSLKFGRFLPDFSLIMPRSVHSLSAINYPTYLVAGRFATWRQIGLEAAYKATSQLEIKLGIFNGLLADPFTLDPLTTNMQMGTIDLGGGNTLSNYVDNNKAKDFLLRLNFFATKELTAELSFWLGMPRNANNADDNDLVLMGGPGIEYNNGKLQLLSEFMFRVVDYGPDGADSVTSLALWAHAGYMLNDWLEGIFRIDWLEPNLDGDADMRMRLTTGPHFWTEQKHFGILVDLFLDFGLEGGDAKGDEIIGILAQASLAW